MLTEILFGMLSTIIVTSLFIFLVDPAESPMSNDRFDNSTRWARLQSYKDDQPLTGASDLPPLVPKETILAMIQRGVYRVNIDAVRAKANDCIGSGHGGTASESDSDEHFARKMITSACKRLDANWRYASTLATLLNGVCDRINERLDAHQANVCKYNKHLTTITQARMLVEKEVRETKVGKLQTKTATNEQSGYQANLELKSQKSTVDCTTVTENMDDLLSVYEQYVDSKDILKN
ncbi:Hypothetical protein CINCED_3A013237 [Cinara cedri]|uniref:Uncharacterized protein n=1 Tax=Cinara cedri TaxID=506608 RepID=A0A5E4N840_9HEMI|nr:Hypothetical protein CINCED_3A013237 [Cinara cedri]